MVSDPAVGETPDMPDERGPVRLPLSPVSGERLRPWSVVASVVAAVAVIVAVPWGYAALLGVVGALALVVVAGWPLLGGSRTPVASGVVLGLAGAGMLAATVRADITWLPAAAAFGIVASFFHQLLRPPPREGLVLTLVAAFSGLVVLGSGALLAATGHEADSRPVVLVAMVAAAVGVVGDLLVSVRVVRPFLGLVVLVFGAGAAWLAASWSDQLTTLGALGAGAAVATVSWSLRRVLALQPAALGVLGQVTLGVGSILLAGAVVRIFAILS